MEGSTSGQSLDHGADEVELSSVFAPNLDTVLETLRWKVASGTVQ